MQAIINTFLTGIMPLLLPIFGTLITGAVTWVCAKLAQKYNVQITDEMQVRVRSAIIRAIQTLLAKHMAGGGTLASFNMSRAATEAAMMVLKSNPDSTKKIGANQLSLTNNALALATRAAFEMGVVNDDSNATDGAKALLK